MDKRYTDPVADLWNMIALDWYGGDPDEAEKMFDFLENYSGYVRAMLYDASGGNKKYLKPLKDAK